MTELLFSNIKEWLADNQTTLITVFSANAICGILVFEMMYCRVNKRFTDGNEERDCRFPMFRRTDVKKWRRWHFYPGAMTLLPIRAILLIVDMLLMVIILKFLTLCHNFKKGPLKNGCLKSTVAGIVKINAYIWVAICGHITSREKVDFDYSEYLGEDYKMEYKKGKKIPTMISNHVSWIDSQILFKYYSLAFIIAKIYKKIPVFSSLAQTIDSVFIDRGGSVEARQKIIDDIKERQEKIETTGDYT